MRGGTKPMLKTAVLTLPTDFLTPNLHVFHDPAFPGTTFRLHDLYANSYRAFPGRISFPLYQMHDPAHLRIPSAGTVAEADDIVIGAGRTGFETIVKSPVPGRAAG